MTDSLLSTPLLLVLTDFLLNTWRKLHSCLNQQREKTLSLTNMLLF